MYCMYYFLTNHSSRAQFSGQNTDLLDGCTPYFSGLSLLGILVTCCELECAEVRGEAQ